MRKILIFLSFVLLAFNTMSQNSTWKGNYSNDWHDPSNWTGSVPKNKATISSGATYYPVILSDVVIESLVMSENSTLTIGVGGSLMVNNSIVNNGYILVKSDINGCGCLINPDDTRNGGVITVERYLVGATYKPYHYISTPNGGTFTDIWRTGDYNIYTYDETVNNPDLDYGWTRFLSGNLLPGIGYAVVSHYTNRVMKFTGTPLSSLNRSVTYTNTSSPYPKVDPRGWNLIGNPFSCSFLADSFLIQNAGKFDPVYGALYFWNDIDGDINRYQDYAVYNLMGGVSAAPGNPGNVPNGEVSIGQGFFVKVKSSTNLVFNSNQRRSSNNYQFFIPDINKKYSKYKLGLFDNYNNYNEILVGFSDESTLGIDILWDAAKLKGNPALSLYSLVSDYHLVIQSLPMDKKNDIVVDIGFEVNKSGYYRLKTMNIDNLDCDFIYLYDKYLNKKVDILTSVYDFESGSGVFEDRFELIFVLKKNDENKNIRNIDIYSSLSEFDYKNEFDIEIYNIIGQRIERKSMTSGVYIIKEGDIFRKILIL